MIYIDHVRRNNDDGGESTVTLMIIMVMQDGCSVVFLPDLLLNIFFNGCFTLTMGVSRYHFSQRNTSFGTVTGNGFMTDETTLLEEFKFLVKSNSIGTQSNCMIQFTLLTHQSQRIF